MMSRIIPSYVWSLTICVFTIIAIPSTIAVGVTDSQCVLPETRFSQLRVGQSAFEMFRAYVRYEGSAMGMPLNSRINAADFIFAGYANCVLEVYMLGNVAALNHPAVRALINSALPTSGRFMIECDVPGANLTRKPVMDVVKFLDLDFNISRPLIPSSWYRDNSAAILAVQFTDIPTDYYFFNVVCSFSGQTSVGRINMTLDANIGYNGCPTGTFGIHCNNTCQCPTSGSGCHAFSGQPCYCPTGYTGANCADVATSPRTSPTAVTPPDSCLIEPSPRSAIGRSLIEFSASVIRYSARIPSAQYSGGIGVTDQLYKGYGGCLTELYLRTEDLTLPAAITILKNRVNIDDLAFACNITPPVRRPPVLAVLKFFEQTSTRHVRSAIPSSWYTGDQRIIAGLQMQDLPSAVDFYITCPLSVRNPLITASARLLVHGSKIGCPIGMYGEYCNKTCQCQRGEMCGAFTGVPCFCAGSNIRPGCQAITEPRPTGIAANLNVTLNCGSSVNSPMTITLNEKTDNVFANVYVEGAAATCNFVRSGYRSFSLFNARMNGGRDCNGQATRGINWQAYSVSIMTQQTAGLSRYGDQGYRFVCNYSQSGVNQVTVRSRPTPVLGAGVPEILSTQTVLAGAINQAYVMTVHDSSDLMRQITRASMGQRIALKIRMLGTDSDEQSLRVRKCTAGNSQRNVTFLENYCGRLILDQSAGFITRGLETVLQDLEAFRIQGAFDNIVTFFCDVEPCSDYGQCQGANCVVPGKRRRRRDTLQTDEKQTNAVRITLHLIIDEPGAEPAEPTEPTGTDSTKPAESAEKSTSVEESQLIMYIVVGVVGGLLVLFTPLMIYLVCVVVKRKKRNVK